ncbi:MAG: hypothetical protein EHM81_08120, partial [Chloroflexi bacterium]
MPRTFCLLLLLALAACAPAPKSQNNPIQSSSPLFFTLRLADATLVLARNPDSGAPAREIPLEAPAGCGFWSLNPAPTGPSIAIEWECAFGPIVQVLDTGTGKASFPVQGPAVDHRFLAWEPDGGAVYLKVGTLSNPQVLRVDIGSRQSL